MRLGGALIVGIVVCSTAIASGQPYPQPYPGPYPYPYQPQPVAPPPKPEKPQPPPAMVFFHGLCPEGTQPKCDGGLWMGLRGTMMVGPTDTAIGMALDFKAGFGFGFGWEVSSDIEPDERDSMAHVMAGAEAGIGPGVRAGRIEILPVLGIGGDAVAWGSTKTDDDPYSEAFWYGHVSLNVRLDGYTLMVAGARKFRGRGIDRVYEDRVEAGIAFLSTKDPVPVTVQFWYSHYDTHTLAGLALGVGPKELVTRQATPVKAPQ